MTNFTHSMPNFLYIPYKEKDKECFTMINPYEIAEIQDDGETLRIKLRNQSPRNFSGAERQLIIEQLISVHIN